MNFQVDPALAARLAAIRAFVIERVQPLERLLLDGRWAALGEALDDCRSEVKARGWWAPNLPPAEGGCGQGLVALGLISEVLGRSPLGHFSFGCQAPDAGNAELLLAHGTRAQRERFLEPLAAGEIRSCFLMTEPEFAGSNPTELAYGLFRLAVIVQQIYYRFVLSQTANPRFAPFGQYCRVLSQAADSVAAGRTDFQGAFG